MNEHYFSEHPHSATNPQWIQDSLRGQSLSLKTDRSVFSRQGIDEGTRVLVENLPNDMFAGRALDLGCGYGPVGIAVALSFPELEVWMVDVNARAVELAKTNATHNHVSDRVQVLQGDGFHAVPEAVRFDWVILNPPIRAGKSVVFELYYGAYQRLSDHGELYVVIQKKHGAESSEKYLKQIGFEVRIIARDKGYRVLACKK